MQAGDGRSLAGAPSLASAHERHHHALRSPATQAGDGRSLAGAPSLASASGRSLTVDVLVVGAGPAGSAVAATVAAGGHTVVVVDRAAASGGKPCGELLTPRALVALERSGIGPDRLAGFHAVTHVRFTTRTASSAARW